MTNVIEQQSWHDKICNRVYMNKYEKIISARKDIFGYEVLLRDPSKIEWDNASIDWLNQNTINQLLELEKKRLNISNYFINIEWRQLTNFEMLEKLANTIYNLKSKGINIFLEITERNNQSIKNIDLSEIKSFFDFNFVIDDLLISQDYRLNDIERGVYSFIKIDSLNEFNTEDFLSLGKWMEKTKELSSIKFIAEKIENKELYQKALQLPFDYFQGFYFYKSLH